MRPQGTKVNRDGGDCLPPSPNGWRTGTWVMGLANGLQCLNIIILALGLWRQTLILPKGGILNHCKALLTMTKHRSGQSASTKQIKIYGEKLPVKVGWKQCWGQKIDGRGERFGKMKEKINEDKYSLTLITFRERDELKFTKKVTLQIQMIVILLFCTLYTTIQKFRVIFVWLHFILRTSSHY